MNTSREYAQNLIDITSGYLSPKGRSQLKDLIDKGQDIEMTPTIAARIKSYGFIIVPVEENRGNEKVCYAIYNDQQDVDERESKR